MTKYARLKEDITGYDTKNLSRSAVIVPKGTIVDLGDYIQTAFFNKIVICYDPEKRAELFEILE